jgi:ABC-2 type transport system permease protein
MIHANKVLMLVRREFWENRSLWITPLVISGVLLISAAFSGGPITDGGGGLHFGPQVSGDDLLTPDAGKRDGIYAGYIGVLTLVQLVVLGIVVFFYLLDCLLSERKDRSILFWKSLPVSDTEVVLSKAATALVVAPLIVLGISAITQILFGAVLWLRFHGTVVGDWVTVWNPAVWLKVQVGSLVLIPAVIVWYLPLAGYLLLVSVWARKNAFLWAVLPPVSVLLVEGMILQSHNFADFLGRRFAGAFMIMRFPERDGDSLPTLGEFLSHVARVFTHYETWLGVLVAAAFVVAVIRIRRYRDDS